MFPSDRLESIGAYLQSINVGNVMVARFLQSLWNW